MKNNNQLGIYIHIPFCVQKCIYCDFLSAPANEETKYSYVHALIKEIEKTSKDFKDRDVNSIFFGGGTPSTLDPILIVEIMDALRTHFQINEFAEVSLECNPGTLDEDKAYIYRNAGINRISFGLQSVNNDELKMLGRIHSFEEFRDSFRLARNYGFNNINIDIMTGLPGQTKESLEKTLKTVLAFKPEHISAYGLILEEGTKLFENINNYPSIPSDEDDRDMYELGRAQITKAKLRQYEISNYAKKGYECIHNLKYWNREEYLGFGIGAASFVNETRYSNTRDINAYMDTLNKKDMKLDSIRENVEKLDINDAKEEFVFLGLRKTDGISLEDYKERFGEDINKQYEKEIASNVEKGLLVIEGDRMKLTRSGVDISNSVMADFIIG